jgi:LytR cell envelope-related transcriptional attenuator
MTTASPTELAPDAVEPHPPRSPSTERARRRLERRRTRRRQQARVAIIVAVSALLVLGAVTITRSTRSGDADNAAGVAPTRTTGRGVPPSVLAQRDADGVITAVSVLAPGTGADGHLIMVPPGTMTELPSYGLDAVSRSFQLGGAPLLRAALENLLGVNLERIDLIDDASLTALVAPAGTLRVRVASQVEEVEPSGRVKVLWPAGETQLAQSDVPRFLAERGQQTDLARLVRHHAFWTAWLALLHAKPALLPRLAGLEHVTPAIKTLAKRAVQYSTLPVEALDGGGGDQVYRVRQAELDGLLELALPGGVALGAEGRTRVQLLNGTGAVAQGQLVAQRLLPAGFRIVVTANAKSFSYRETQVVFYRREQQAAATRVQQALGVGKLVRSRQPLDVVDVTVVVGSDFKG